MNTWSFALNADVSALVAQYVQQSRAKNTLRAYAEDLQHFVAWGGCIPAKPEQIAEYLAHYAQSLSYATLERRLAGIHYAHTQQMLISPTRHPLVKAVLSGIRRQRRPRPRQVAPVLATEIKRMVRRLKGVRGTRDRALLLIGFAGAFRRSELVKLQLEDLHFSRKGVAITLQQSKTDQYGAGRVIAIPYTRSAYCPVVALKAWLRLAKIKQGAVFRGINRYEQVTERGLSSQMVALIVKQRAAEVGLDASRYSGHSLRAGLATSAATQNISSLKIRLQTGHKSDASLNGYIRDRDLFKNNAARVLR